MSAHAAGLGPSLMSITCRCGATADIDDWTRNGLGQELPHGRFQCPACRWAFIRKAQPGKHYPSGFYIPGPITLETVPSEL